MKKILITGGAGFIGSHVVRLFVNNYPEYKIVNLDKLTYAGNLENLKDIEGKSNYEFVKGDIVDGNHMQQLFTKYQFDGVIHLAAESHVDRSIDGPADFIQTNIVGTCNLLEVARAYSAFANGGFRVTPHVIDRIEQGRQGVVFRAQNEIQIAITAENRFLMYSMMKDVIRIGTGRRAKSLERADIAGKTGTTNDYRDAWFNGYNESVVTIVYVGKDNHLSLGKKETGGRVALPAWITYMRGALEGVPETEPELPPGIEVSGSYTAGGETRDEYEDVTVEKIYAPQVAEKTFHGISEKPRAVDDLF